MVWKVKLLEKLKGFNYLKQERGSILVLVVLLLPIMFGCLGFAYDFGNLYMHRARLQNVADAAALAGARAYLDSQATDSKDNIDGTVVKTSESASGQLAPDSRSTDRTGRPAEYAYIASVANVKNPPSITHGDSQHPAADKAADDYIFKNIINLGNEVKSDKWSHYALNSNGDNPKTFYRVGLSEEVRLYFLPIIKNVPKTQTVRVGAIALVVPGETDPGSGGGTATITSPSIFDNLFTISEWLYTESTGEICGSIVEGIGDTRLRSNFIGNMVYTHFNSKGDEDSGNIARQVQPASFFTMSVDQGGQDTYRYNHLYEDEIGTNVASGTGGTINDPYIDTFYDTKAYLDVFRKKLHSPHVDLNTTTSYTFTGDENLNASHIYHVNGSDDSFWYDGKDYYILDDDANYKTITSDGVTYQLCYSKLGGIWDSNAQYVLCAKNENDTKYFFVDNNGKKSNYYINKISDWQWQDEKYLSDYQSYGFTSNLNKESFIQVAYNNSVKSNVFHIPLKRSDGQVNDSFDINIDSEISASEDDINKPIYVIVDGINQVKISGNASTNKRPLILIFLSEKTTQLKYEYNGNFVGTIYAPISTFEYLKTTGSFTGNIIAKTINMQASETSATFIQENYLEQVKYNYVLDSKKGDFINENGVWVRVAAGKGTHRREAVYKFTEAAAGKGEYIQDANGEYIDANGVKWKKVDKGTGTHTGDFDYLYKDDGVKAVSDATKKKIEEANKIAKLTEDDKKDIYTKLGLTDEEMAAMENNPNWYNEQTLSRKKQLYQSWKTLYESGEYDATKKDFLWPWNEHFDIETGESEPTGEILRLINFRTDFQEKNPDGTVNNGEKDPFIYLSLDGKSY